MYSSKHATADNALLPTEWVPQLLRFFYLLNGDQQSAESLAIDTLAEFVGNRRTRSRTALIRLALRKAETAHCPPNGEDRVVGACVLLPHTPRVVVALVQGLGLTIEDLPDVTGMGLSESKRLFVEGLFELHRLLSPGTPSGIGSKTGDL